MKQYILRNWFWIAVGLILTRLAMELCYMQRGSFEVGGEIFILPIMLVMVKILEDDEDK